MCFQHNVTLILVPEIPDFLPLKKVKSHIRKECLKYGVELPSNFQKKQGWESDHQHFLPVPAPRFESRFSCQPRLFTPDFWPGFRVGIFAQERDGDARKICLLNVPKLPLPPQTVPAESISGCAGGCNNLLSVVS